MVPVGHTSTSRSKLALVCDFVVSASQASASKFPKSVMVRFLLCLSVWILCMCVVLCE